MAPSGPKHCLLVVQFNHPNLMKMIQVPNLTTYVLWYAIRGRFLDNADQCAVFALQEFHSLYQGDLSITDYCSRLKQLSDLLRDLGHWISGPSLVINTLRGLNSKFSYAISVLTAQKPLLDFNFVRDYLVQNEANQHHSTKMEANTALLAAANTTTSTGSPSAPPTRLLTNNSAPSPPPQSGRGDRRKKCKKTSTGGGGPLGGQPAGVPSTPLDLAYAPWTGIVQAWQMPILHPSGAGFTSPGNAQQPTLTASTMPNAGFMLTYGGAPPLQPPTSLLSTLQGAPAPHQYQGGGDWVLDTGASSHMENNPGILHSSSSPTHSSTIIVGNDTPLLVQRVGHTTINNNGSPLHIKFLTMF